MLTEELDDKVYRDPNSGCWVWLGAGGGGGYGRIGVKFAHRVVYEELVGPIPEALVLDHLCRVKPCVNPYHLEPVTHAVNVSRANAAVTHCPKGHRYSLENCYYRSTGYRRCRECNRLYMERRRRQAGIPPRRFRDAH